MPDPGERPGFPADRRVTVAGQRRTSPQLTAVRLEKGVTGFVVTARAIRGTGA